MNDSSPIVASGSVGSGNLFTVGAGLGCPSVTDADANDGYLRIKDFVLEADTLVAFPPNTASPPGTRARYDFGVRVGFWRDGQVYAQR